MRYLPRVDGAGHGVVLAVVHGIWGPAVPTHALCAVVPGHGQMLGEKKGIIGQSKEEYSNEGEGTEWREGVSGDD